MSKLQQIKHEMSIQFIETHNTQSHQSAANQYFQPTTVSTSNGETSSSSLPGTFSVPISGQSHIATNPSTSEEPHTIKRSSNGKRSPEELEDMAHTLERLTSCIAHDHQAVAHPDMDSPFIDTNDVIKRLLPYHVFQQPRQDLHVIVTGKGKEKATDSDRKEDIYATKMALELVQKQEAIRKRWRNLKIRSARRSSPDDQAYYLAQVVLESDRSENAWLGNELRTARTEAERIEREKRANANASRTSHFAAVPQAPMPTMQTQYYRAYPYAYTQAYGSPALAPTMSTFSIAPPPSPAPTYTPYQPSSAIPVQLPVASLPALHALGIIPVPAASLPPEGQPQPPAVLRGSTANGTILSLEINVSLLQSAQMSGLAMVLNSLVSRSNAVGATNTSSTAPQTSKSTDTSTS